LKLKLTLYCCLPSMLLMVLGTAAQDSQSISPSFDCARATQDDEMAICSSRKLADLDVLIAIGFTYLQHQIGKSKTKRIGAPLLKRRQACQSDEQCIYERQLEFIKVLQAYGAPITLPNWTDASARKSDEPLPTIIGQCSRTIIDDIGGRLRGDSHFNSGTSVSFSNGGYQVSYDREPAIISSFVGDLVTICLTSVPENCPLGDDRGKEYQTTNHRTGESWTLPDSQHSCGGA
jgi:uncharacterized protein